MTGVEAIVHLKYTGRVDAPDPPSTEGDQEASVLGNLPRSRPSVRSPRREDARAKARARARKAETEAPAAEGDGA